MELTEVYIKMDAMTLTAVQQGLQALASMANTALASIQSQVQEQIASAAETKPSKLNGHASAAA